MQIDLFISETVKIKTVFTYLICLFILVSEIV